MNGEFNPFSGIVERIGLLRASGVDDSEILDYIIAESSNASVNVNKYLAMFGYPKGTVSKGNVFVDAYGNEYTSRDRGEGDLVFSTKYGWKYHF